MKAKIIIDNRMKSKIEELIDCSENENNECYSVRLKDIKDTFWFDDQGKLQEFLNNQTLERFYDKELRKGYFDYVNEYKETSRYYVEAKRGTLKLIEEKCIS